MIHVLTLMACADPPAPAASTPVATAQPADAPSTVRDAFPPPAGAVSLPPSDFASSLHALRVKGAGEAVRTHDGQTVAHRARVVELPLVRGDLQQCADSAIRLRARYLRANDLPVAFHSTSGDLLAWDRYQEGERAYATGNSIAWRAAGGAPSWEAYLTDVFMWAGTWSLEHLDTVPAASPQPGDLMIVGGFPGHAIVLLDVAESSSKTFVLVGEGYMPAQDFHIEIGPVEGWWPYDDGVRLPHWELPASSLRRWPAAPSSGTP